MTSNNILFLMGPTAAGKTATAIEIARQYPAEIISVDSALIYREMDIGTAKPEPALMAEIPHHLIDICDPSETYSVARFCEDAHRLIQEIQSRGKMPLLTGGTMLYFNALNHGLSELPPTDPAIRRECETLLLEKGVAHLYACLQQEDPESASRLEPADKQRIIRALEVFRSTGKPIHSYWVYFLQTLKS